MVLLVDSRFFNGGGLGCGEIELDYDGALGGENLKEE